MSFAAVSWAWRQSPGSVAAKFLLLVLADWADQNGAASPSVEAMAAQTQINASAIPDYLKVLEAQGLGFIHWPECVGARKSFVVLSDDFSRAYARSLGRVEAP